MNGTLSVKTRNKTNVHMNLLSHNDRCHHLPKILPFPPLGNYGLHLQGYFFLKMGVACFPEILVQDVVTQMTALLLVIVVRHSNVTKRKTVYLVHSNQIDFCHIHVRNRPKCVALRNNYNSPNHLIVHISTASRSPLLHTKNIGN